MHTLIDKYKFCYYDILEDVVRLLQKVDDPYHSILYLNTGTLTWNEIGTLLKVRLEKLKILKKVAFKIKPKNSNGSYYLPNGINWDGNLLVTSKCYMS